MRNLKILCHKWHKQIEVSSVSILEPPCDEADEIIVSDNLKVFKVNTVTEEISLLLDLETVLKPEAQIERKIVNFAYFSIECILVIAMNIGDVIRLDMNSMEVLESTNISTKGIKAMQVSPDNELLVFVSLDHRVFLTDCRLDIINSVSLEEDHFGDGEFVNVGWGKKETQFHGSEGKEAAKIKTAITEYGDDTKGNNVLITWRGDGALFAIGFCYNSVYNFKVFDREAALKFTSEKQPGIECNFVWRPSGNLIATTQQYPNKYVVAFFEKNGLKHGEFTLPFKKSDMAVKKLSWSADSEVLCVWCLEMESLKSLLLIYTVNNYHWYLKQSIPFSPPNKITALAWDESGSTGNEKLLHIFLEGGIYAQYKWVWFVDKSIGKSEKDEASVGVIDGRNILLTSFKKAVVPPPMAALTVNCEKNVNHIVFASNITLEDSSSKFIDSNSFITVLEDGRFNLYTTNNASEPKLFGSATVKPGIEGPSALYQYLWVSEETILCVCSNAATSLLMVIKLKLNDGFDLEVLKTIPISDLITGLAPVPKTNTAIVQTSSGKLLLFSKENNIVAYYFDFPENCYEFDVCVLPNDDSTVFAFGLTHRHRFYINDKEVANNVNSFFIHSDFLILTTLQHQLLCCPLSIDLVKFLHVNSTFENKSGNSFNATISQRRLERGSRLVTAVSCDSRTILQLPRGNIEAIQPRALSLKLIGSFLNKCQYLKAFDLMRKQRINLNLIYDHNPVKFFENIGLLISEIKNPSWLSLFISELDNVDVTRTMYSSSYTRKNDLNSEVTRKVITVCKLMRDELENHNKCNENLLPILTTYVKTNSIKDLEKSLLLIKCVKMNATSGGEKSVVSADEALKYLLYLVNVNHLYDIALGLYDFDLAMYVASKSQKDPKEYVPYLNGLKTMEENYKKFSIDNDLKRYESAIVNLIACGKDKDEELISYVKQHSLYKTALRNIDRNDPKYQLCAEEYANFLVRRKNYSEAGIMFKRSRNIVKAIDSFIEAVDWQAAMSLVEDFNIPSVDSAEIRRKLLVKLKDAKRYSEAVDLLLHSGNDSVEDLLTCSLEGGLYRQSLSLCKRFKRSDLIESTLRKAVMEEYSSLMSTISQHHEQFIQQKVRLLLVRQLKAEVGENDEDLPEDCDLFSDTSSLAPSNTTRTSGKSFRSSKNRRKHERKLVSLKEGSRFEDIALVRALYTLVTMTFGLRQDVANLNFVLQWLDKDEEVLQLQNCLESLLKEMAKCFSEIWTPELSSYNPVNTQDINNEGPDAQSTLEPYLRIPPVIQDIKWKLEGL